MSHRRFVVAPFLIVVSAALVEGCENGRRQHGPSPAVSIQVSGPDSVESGRSAQFFAIMRLTNGSTKSATDMSNLTWTSSNPSVLSVSDAGMVTAALLASGEAVITAEITTSAGLRDDTFRAARKVVIQGRAIVSAQLEVSQQGAPDEPYVFAVKLAESVGVAATIIDLWLSFDDGWGGQCNWTADKLRETRLPANGTLAVEPLTCRGFYDKNSKVDVEVYLRDDNGHQVGAFLTREPLGR